MCVQVCQAEWVVTRGGLVPKLLHPDVVRGAANVASLRRLRYLVHGAIALRYTKWGLWLSHHQFLAQFTPTLRPWRLKVFWGGFCLLAKA